jgi:hypothetical protein
MHEPPFEIVHTDPQSDLCTIRWRWAESTTPQEREADMRLLGAVIESMVRDTERMVDEMVFGRPQVPTQITDPPKLTYDDIRRCYELMAKRGYE